MSGLPPLKLPLSDISAQFGAQGPSSAFPASPSETCSSPSSFAIPIQDADADLSPQWPRGRARLASAGTGTRRAADAYPVASEIPEFSPASTAADILPGMSPESGTDSPILPVDIAQNPSGSDGIESLPASPANPEMDAFVLAAAVASSDRSAFSLPSSVPSVAALPPVGADVLLFDRPRSPEHGLFSITTDVPTTHREPEIAMLSAVAGPRTDGFYALDVTRARRRSAPPPRSAWYSPPMEATRTISSRVDVGDEVAASRAGKHGRQPVLRSVRKLGARIRGLFRHRGDAKTANSKTHPGGNPEFGMLTTVTNVEYESVRIAGCMRAHFDAFADTVALGASDPGAEPAGEAYAEPPSLPAYRLPLDDAVAARPFTIDVRPRLRRRVDLKNERAFAQRGTYDAAVLSCTTPAPAVASFPAHTYRSQARRGDGAQVAIVVVGGWE